MRISCEGVDALGRFMISLAMCFGKEAATRNFVKIPWIFAKTDTSTANTVRLEGVRTTRSACGHRVFIVQFGDDVSACLTHPHQRARARTADRTKNRCGGRSKAECGPVVYWVRSSASAGEFNTEGGGRNSYCSI